MPRCFDTDVQFIHWVEADRIVQAGRKYQQSLQCLDCTPAYQQQMIDEGRCEKPEVQFKRINGGELIGFEPIVNDDSADMVGVCWHKDREMWVAKIWGSGRYRTLGYFATKAEAKAERIKAMLSKRVPEAA